MARRVRAQQELGRCMPAAEPELVAGAVVIYGGQRAEGQPAMVNRAPSADCK